MAKFNFDTLPDAETSFNFDALPDVSNLQQSPKFNFDALPDAKLDFNTLPETQSENVFFRLGKVAAKGASEGVIGNVLKIVKPDIFKNLEAIDPKGWIENSVRFTTNLVADAPVFGAMFKVAGLALKGISFGAKASPIMLKEVPLMIRPFAGKVVKSASELGLASALHGGASSAVSQIAERELFDPMKVVSTGLISGGFGAALGGVLGSVGAGLDLAFKPKIPKFKINPEELAKTQQIVDEIHINSVSRAQELFKKGLITEKQVPTIQQITYLEELNAKIGDRLDLTPKNPDWIDKSINAIESMDAIDTRVGTKASETVRDFYIAGYKRQFKNVQLNNTFEPFYKVLRKSNFNDTGILPYIEYGIDDSNELLTAIKAGLQPKFNPSARIIRSKINPNLIKMQRAAYAGPIPDVETLAALKGVRTELSKIVTEDPALLSKTGFIDGYVPLIPSFTARAKVTPAKQLESIIDPRFTKVRVEGLFDSSKHVPELDLSLNAYIHKVSRYQSLEHSGLVNKAFTEIVKLRNSNQSWAAGELEDIIKVSTGIDKSSSLEHLISKRIMNVNEDLVEELSKFSDRPSSLIDEMGSMLKTFMYKAKVFLNPPLVLALQPGQNFLILGPEVGQSNVAYGTLKWLAGGPEKKLALAHMPMMRSPEMNWSEAVVPKLQNKALKTIGTVLGLPSVPGEVLFNATDTANRGIGFIAARNHLRNLVKWHGEQQGLLRASEGLLPTEAASLFNIWKKEGIDAAASMAGVIRSTRANLVYSLANAPKIFRDGLGAHVPFRTWGGAMWTRLVSDVRTGSTKQLANRLIQPMAMITLARLLTGYDIPGAHPMESFPGAFGFQAFPFIGNPVKALNMYGPGDFKKLATGDVLGFMRSPGAIPELLRFTPPGELAARLSKQKVGDFAQDYLRLKPIKRDNWNEVVLPSLIKKALGYK